MSIKLYEWQLEVEPLELVGESVKPFVERLLDDCHAAGLAVKAINGFYNQMPDRTETPCLMIRDLGGTPYGINPIATGLVLFQARGGTFEEAREFLAKVYNHYQGATGKYITGYRIISARAVGLPASMGEDANQRHFVGFNMEFLYTSTNQLSENVGYGGTRDPNEP